MRIEVREKYIIPSEGMYSERWWMENMPEGTKLPESAKKWGYRRTMPCIDHIERPIEIKGSDREFILRFWDGRDMICEGSYDSFCIQLNDMEAKYYNFDIKEEDI